MKTQGARCRANENISVLENSVIEEKRILRIPQILSLAKDAINDAKVKLFNF